jgi:hypothetical protein
MSEPLTRGEGHGAARRTERGTSEGSAWLGRAGAEREAEAQ